MAITLDDFNKIWASTSPLTPYSFTEANYKSGWNFIGATPPSRQMWDYLQKNNDEKMQYLANNYLPLSGGTMTGPITKNGIIAKAVDESNTVNLYGGTGYDGGATVILNGKSASNAGQFNIGAYDGTNRKILSGKPDGTLTWGGLSLTERSYGISLTSTAGENTYTFSVNTNGAVVFAKRGANASCHMVDYWTAGSVKLFSAGTDPITITKSANSNSVTITNTYSSAIAVKIINGSYL